MGLNLDAGQQSGALYFVAWGCGNENWLCGKRCPGAEVWVDSGRLARACCSALKRRRRTGLRYLALLLEHGEVLCDQFGVPEAAGSFFAHGLGGLVVGLWRLVGTGSAESVVDIDDLEDARQDRDLGPGQALG